MAKSRNIRRGRASLPFGRGLDPTGERFGLKPGFISPILYLPLRTDYWVMVMVFDLKVFPSVSVAMAVKL